MTFRHSPATGHPATSFDEEADVLARMHDFTSDNGLRMVGKRHEIYLSDVRKVAPEKRRTMLGQPVRIASSSSG